MKLRTKIAASHPILKVLIWLLIMVLSFAIVMVGYSFYVAATGNQSAVQLRMLQLVQSVLVFVVPALLAVWCWSSRPAEWLYINKGSRWQTFVLTFVLMVLIQPGINLIGTWNESIRLPESLAEIEQMLRDMEESAKELTELLTQSPTFGIFLLNIVVFALAPAVGEELTFRGVMLGLMDENRSAGISRRTHIAVWVVGIIFSLVHFQFYGFFPRMILGVILGYLLVWSGSLWVPILAHFTNNALVILFCYLSEQTTISADSIESFGIGTTSWAGWLSLLLSIGLLWLVRSVALKRSSAPRQAVPEE